MSLLGVAPEDRPALEAAALAVRPRRRRSPSTGIGDERCTITGRRRRARRPGQVWRAALEAAGEAAADVLATMDALAGPRARLVVAGGWADGEAARAVKAAHLGPFTTAGSAYVGARGAALTAGRAAGLVAPLRERRRRSGASGGPGERQRGIEEAGPMAATIARCAWVRRAIAAMRR